MLTAEEGCQLKLIQLWRDFFDSADDFLLIAFSLRIIPHLVDEFEHRRQIFEFGAEALGWIDDGFQPIRLRDDFLRGSLILPKSRVGHLPIERLDPCHLLVAVKDTSKYGPRGG